MNTELIARLAAEAGFQSQTVTATNLGTGEQSLSRTFEIMSVVPEDVLAKFAALVAEECARQTERSTCAEQAAATIRALFPPAP